MYLRIGTYRHALAEAGISVSRESLLNEFDEPYATLVRWGIQGLLQGASVADLTAKIKALEAAYSVKWQDIVLLDSDGSTPTAMQIRDSDTIGGIRVTRPPSFPTLSGAEYVTYVNYEIEIEAEIPITSGAKLLAFNEVLQFGGGGPRDVFLELLNGLPQKQRVQQATVYRVSQVGNAVGYGGWPQFSLPIWPSAEDRPARNFTRTVQRRREYVINWSYRFHSASQLIGSPAVR